MTYSDVGGCKEQIEKLREVVETPLLHVSKAVVFKLVSLIHSVPCALKYIFERHSDFNMDAGLKCCVVFLGETVDSHSASLRSVGLICIVLGSWQFPGESL